MQRRARALGNSLVLAAGLASLAMTQDTGGFTGTWLRDPSASDDVEEKLEGAVRDMLEKAERRRRGAVPLPDDPDRTRQLERGLGSVILAAPELRIEMAGNELHVDDDSGRIRIYYLDGKKHVRQTRRGVSLETVSVRRGNRVEVEEEAEEGGKIREAYVLSPDGNRLELEVRLEGKRLKEPLVVRSVYDRER